MIDAYCSETQYADHVQPIFLSLDPAERGTFFGSSAVMEHLAGSVTVTRGYPPPGDSVTLVASYQDHRAVSRRGRKTIYLEHGSGQRYECAPDAIGRLSYSGSDDHDDCALFLCPGETVAERWRARYPDTPAVAVGCPRLDKWHRKLREESESQLHRREHVPTTVAFSFHAEIQFVPETMGAWRHYRRGMDAFVAEARQRGWRLIGHGHPRIWNRLEAHWRRLGVEPVREWGDVLDLLTSGPSVYVCDNSSTLPEAASCGVPLVWLNAPWFKTEHGGRFFDWPRGQVQCDGPEGLVAAVEEALADPPGVRAAREAMVESVYVACDGKATERAVAALRCFV